MIIRKRGLLKKPEKTLNSPSSIFLALMRLKSWRNTKTWNTKV